MTTWNDLVVYIKRNYKVNSEEPGLLSMTFETQDMRSQTALVTLQAIGSNNEEWVTIESAVGEIGKVDLERLIREVGTYVCGGVAASGEYVVLRHSAPIADMNTDEFENPLALVTLTADQLEKALVGVDAF